MAKDDFDELVRAKAERAELERKLAEVKQRIRKGARAAETRRKVIGGAHLFAAAEKHLQTAEFVRQMIDGLPERDRVAFEGWEPEWLAKARELANQPKPPAPPQNTETSEAMRHLFGTKTA